MNQLLYDDEDYYFQISEDLADDKQFILIIYDIVDNKRRIRFSKLEGYGKRVQKSAFEAMLSEKSYEKLKSKIPEYIDRSPGQDNVRIYKITGKGKVVSWGDVPAFEGDIIVI